jgi:hypothetical protein
MYCHLGNLFCKEKGKSRNLPPAIIRATDYWQTHTMPPSFTWALPLIHDTFEESSLQKKKRGRKPQVFSISNFQSKSTVKSPSPTRIKAPIIPESAESDSSILSSTTTLAGSSETTPRTANAPFPDEVSDHTAVLRSVSPPMPESPHKKLRWDPTLPYVPAQNPSPLRGTKHLSTPYGIKCRSPPHGTKTLSPHDRTYSTRIPGDELPMAPMMSQKKRWLSMYLQEQKAGSL